MIDEWKIEGGILLIDKPLTWTSFDAVKKLRNVLGYKKIGHAGTLDPLATGMLVLCFGRFTKRIEEIQSMGKVYTATLELGKTTPSFDLESSVDQTFPYDHITKELVEATLPQFVGNIEQYPPKFSAVKIDGKRAYDYAREGQEVEMKPREVQIDKIELLSLDLPFLELRIHCGKGTYIRSLARDLGIALGSGAHLTKLHRDSIGPFICEKAMTPTSFNSAEDIYLHRITSIEGL